MKKSAWKQSAKIHMNDNWINEKNSKCERHTELHLLVSEYGHIRQQSNAIRQLNKLIETYESWKSEVNYLTSEFSMMDDYNQG